MSGYSWHGSIRKNVAITKFAMLANVAADVVRIASFVYLASMWPTNMAGMVSDVMDC